MKNTTEIRQQFFDSLKLGTGEAFLLLRENRAIDFSDLILKGAIRNYAYDMQSEGSRADYIYRLIKNCGQKDRIVAAVIKKLQAEKKDEYGLEQMCDLAVKFYKAGYEEAKQAIYKRFEKNSKEDYAFCGTDSLIKLYGVEGVLKLAEVVGRILLEKPDESESSRRVDDFQKRNKQVDIYKELQKAASDNSFIKAYYDSIQKNKWNKPRIRRIKRFTYELIKEKMEQGRFGFLSSSRNQELTEKEVERLAHEFLAENDNQRKEQYLRFFSSRKFPFDYKPILQIACGSNPRGTRLVEFAIQALKYFTAKEIRALALDKFSNTTKAADYLCLLVGNYQKGDYRLLTSIANRSDDYDFIHSLVFGFIVIYEANPTEECKEPLETIYRKMNCGIHRQDVVQILFENDVLSTKIFTELEFDCDNSTRKLYHQAKNRLGIL